MMAAERLEGRTVWLSIDDPYELIAEEELNIEARVVSVIKRHGRDLLLLDLTSDDPRTRRTPRAAASSRRVGMSVLELQPGIEFWVHGSFFEDEWQTPQGGFIGRLTLQPARRPN